MPFMQKFLELKLSTCLISIHASLVTHEGSMDGRTVTGVPWWSFVCLFVFESGPHNISQDGSELSNLLLSLWNAGIAGLHQYARLWGRWFSQQSTDVKDRGEDSHHPGCYIETLRIKDQFHGLERRLSS